MAYSLLPSLRGRLQASEQSSAQATLQEEIPTLSSHTADCLTRLLKEQPFIGHALCSHLASLAPLGQPTITLTPDEREDEAGGYFYKPTSLGLSPHIKAVDAIQALYIKLIGERLVEGDFLSALSALTQLIRAVWPPEEENYDLEAVTDVSVMRKTYHYQYVSAHMVSAKVLDPVFRALLHYVYAVPSTGGADTTKDRQMEARRRRTLRRLFAHQDTILSYHSLLHGYNDVKEAAEQRDFLPAIYQRKQSAGGPSGPREQKATELVPPTHAYERDMATHQAFLRRQAQVYQALMGSKQEIVLKRFCELEDDLFRPQGPPTVSPTASSFPQVPVGPAAASASDTADSISTMGTMADALKHLPPEFAGFAEGFRRALARLEEEEREWTSQRRAALRDLKSQEPVAALATFQLAVQTGREDVALQKVRSDFLRQVNSLLAIFWDRYHNSLRIRGQHMLGWPLDLALQAISRLFTSASPRDESEEETWQVVETVLAPLAKLRPLVLLLAWDLSPGQPEESGQTQVFKKKPGQNKIKISLSYAQRKALVDKLWRPVWECPYRYPYWDMLSEPRLFAYCDQLLFYVDMIDIVLERLPGEDRETHAQLLLDALRRSDESLRWCDWDRERKGPRRKEEKDRKHGDGAAAVGRKRDDEMAEMAEMAEIVDGEERGEVEESDGGPARGGGGGGEEETMRERKAQIEALRGQVRILNAYFAFRYVLELLNKWKDGLLQGREERLRALLTESRRHVLLIARPVLTVHNIVQDVPTSTESEEHNPAHQQQQQQHKSTHTADSEVHTADSEVFQLATLEKIFALLFITKAQWEEHAFTSPSSASSAAAAAAAVHSPDSSDPRLGMQQEPPLSSAVYASSPFLLAGAVIQELLKHLLDTLEQLPHVEHTRQRRQQLRAYIEDGLARYELVKKVLPEHVLGISDMTAPYQDLIQTLLEAKEDKAIHNFVREEEKRKAEQEAALNGESAMAYRVPSDNKYATTPTVPMPSGRQRELALQRYREAESWTHLSSTLAKRANISIPQLFQLLESSLDLIPSPSPSSSSSSSSYSSASSPSPPPSSSSHGSLPVFVTPTTVPLALHALLGFMDATVAFANFLSVDAVRALLFRAVQYGNAAVRLKEDELVRLKEDELVETRRAG
eukprot:g72288.t1